MSSSDDEPLARTSNGELSKSRISSDVDTAMDNDMPSSSGNVMPGISIRNGPVGEVELDSSHTNGSSTTKRKTRADFTQEGHPDATTSGDESDLPLSKRRKTQVLELDDDDSDVPLASKMVKPVKPPKITAAQVGDKETRVPIEERLAKQKRRIEQNAERIAEKLNRTSPARNSIQNGSELKTESEDDLPLASAPRSAATALKKKSNGSAKTKPLSAPAKKPKKKIEPTEEAEDEDEQEEEYRWWEQAQIGDGTVKWRTLEHNGVLFPPKYDSLPKKVKLIYDGVPVSLHVEAEEVATFYGTMLNSTVNVTNPTFNKNFFADFTEILNKTGHGKDENGKTVKITCFENCDFSKIFDHFESERQRKRDLSAAEKKTIKAEKEEAEKMYTHCKWDGRSQKVGNFRVEPPGLFRGRGEHPKTGRVKQRVKPEQITLNIGKKAKVPPAPPGHKWKEVKHDMTGTWLAMWQENINGAYKYVMLAANSHVKGQSDHKKFEKARELKKHIGRIRKDYNKHLKSTVMADRQRATAIYLIDKLALRAGNEKGEDEADTVGCCSLKFEHVTLRPPNTVIFDFLGKDSIRYYDEVQVDAQVFKNLKIFKKEPKQAGDDIFDRLTTSNLNKHLSNYMQGLTAKVFRTYNASWTMASLLKDMQATGNIAEKVKQYNDANRRVAILCNHKRTVGAAHETQMEKLREKINGLRYQQWRFRMMMLDLDPKLKKKRGAEYFERASHLDDDWVKQFQAAEVEEKRQKISKKFDKDNEKRVGDGEKPLPDKELKERLQEANELEKKYKKENKSGKVEAEGKGPTLERLEASYDKLSQRIETMNLQAQDKDDNKEVALGTSKINYIDPRLTVVFSKKFNVPIERFFSKTLREKFDWAIKSVDENWEF